MALKSAGIFWIISRHIPLCKSESQHQSRCENLVLNFGHFQKFLVAKALNDHRWTCLAVRSRIKDLDFLPQNFMFLSRLSTCLDSSNRQCIRTFQTLLNIRKKPKMLLLSVLIYQSAIAKNQVYRILLYPQQSMHIPLFYKLFRLTLFVFFDQSGTEKCLLISFWHAYQSIQVQSALSRSSVRCTETTNEKVDRIV